MVFDFYPWTLDIDVEATKRFYLENDYSMDDAANTKFMKCLSEKQKDFFVSVGVDTAKIKVEEMAYNVPDGNGTVVKSDRALADFMMCGKFLAIPDFQKELYGSVFETGMSGSLKVITIQKDCLPTYNIDGLGAVFKHSATRFDTGTFRSWECGYIMGLILFKQNHKFQSEELQTQKIKLLQPVAGSDKIWQWIENVFEQ